MEGKALKKIAELLLILSIPLFLILTAAQAARHHVIVEEVSKLEKVQAEWVEENRRLLASLAAAKSRSRIGGLMKEAKAYRMVSPTTTFRIRVNPGMEKRDG